MLSRLPLTICMAIVAIVDSVASAEPEVISEWIKATENVKTVRAVVRVIVYDHAFKTQSHAIGAFGYLAPRHGFWRLCDDSQHQVSRFLQNGNPYVITPFQDVHWRWHADRFRDIQELSKTFTEYTIDPVSKSYVRLWQTDLFTTVDWQRPFLPGRPNKDTVRNWTYSVTRQSASEVWIRASPKAFPQFSSIDLYFQRQPVRLLATRFTDSGGRQVVSIYSEITFAPEKWSEPDLTTYQKIGSPLAP